jgi:hypothetical protein
MSFKKLIEKQRSRFLEQKSQPNRISGFGWPYQQVTSTKIASEGD